jgi:hypothetical protein
LKKILLINLVVFAAAANLFADFSDSLIVLPSSKISFSYSKQTNSSYYNSSGKSITEIPDSITPVHKDGFSFNEERTTLDIRISQIFSLGANDELYAGIELPYIFNYIDRKYKSTSDTVSAVKIIDENSNMPYLGLSVKYLKKLGRVYLVGGLDSKISLTDESKKIAQSDKLFKIKSEVFRKYYSSNDFSLDAYFLDKTAYYNLGASYMINHDPISDMFKVRAGLGLTKIEDAALGVNIEYAKSLKNIDKNFQVNPFYYTNAEEYFKVGVFFDIRIEKLLLIGIKYDVALNGKNTLGQAYLNLNLGFNFDLFNVR